MFCRPSIKFLFVAVLIASSPLAGMRVLMPESEKAIKFNCLNPFCLPGYVKQVLRNYFDPIEPPSSDLSDYKSEPLLREILSGNADVNAVCPPGSSNAGEYFFLYNVRKLSMKDFIFFIDNKVDVNQTNGHSTPLDKICIFVEDEHYQTHATLEKIRMLIRAGAPVNTKHGLSPLFMVLCDSDSIDNYCTNRSSYNYQCAAAKLLLNAGANPNFIFTGETCGEYEKKILGLTPWALFLDFMCSNIKRITPYMQSTIRALLSQGADCSLIKDALTLKIKANQPIYQEIQLFKDHRAALFQAIEQRNYNAVRLLIQKVPLKTYGKGRNTPLHAAVQSGDLRITMLLFGLMPHLFKQKNDNGHSPFLLAADGKNSILCFFMNIPDDAVDKLKRNGSQVMKIS